MDPSHDDDRPSDDNNGLPEKEIPWIFGKPEKCDSVEAKQALSYREICSDARFAINCQGKITLELILKAPMCVYNMN